MKTPFSMALLAIALAAGRAASAPAPTPPADRTRTLLAVFAHPDDETLIGPLLAGYARRGARVRLAIVTDGAQGVRPHAGIPAGPELARARADEARCSCRALGIDPPVLLGFGDGELGRAARPPWAPLAEVEQAIAKVLADVRPDAVITFGPEGGYGHPDHRLVGAVVTELVQSGSEGAPAALFYPGLPKGRLPKRETQLPWSPTEERFLAMHVPYEPADIAAARAAPACHKSQFRAEELEPLARFMEQVLGGRVYLRPWFGAGEADDVFAVSGPPAPDPLSGSWTASVSKSRQDPSHRFQTSTLRFEFAGETLRLTSGGVNMAGRDVSNTVELTLDGKDHPVPGAPDGALVAARRVSARELEILARKDGQVTSRATYVVGPDGRTLTATVSGVDAKGQSLDAVVVYDRQ